MSLFDSRTDRQEKRGRSRDSGKGNAPANTATGAGPVLSAISSGVPTSTTATITWTTSVLANGTVFWGLTNGYAGATSPLQTFTLTTSQSIQITGLVTATTYHYKVRSRDPNTDGYTDSAEGTFVTA